MQDYLSSKGLCHVCREQMTTISAEVSPGSLVNVCEKCLADAKNHFIWICMNCGNVYKRQKSTVIKRLTDHQLKQAYRVCEHMQIIQGIERCIECGPDEILEYVSMVKKSKNGWHC
jgi:hypothetical protein